MFRRPLKQTEIWSCSAVGGKKGICGVVPDIDAGSILTQPYVIRQTDSAKNIIPEDVYATRPFYFGGSNVRFYDQNADNIRVQYGVKRGNNKTVMDFQK